MFGDSFGVEDDNEFWINPVLGEQDLESMRQGSSSQTGFFEIDDPLRLGDIEFADSGRADESATLANEANGDLANISPTLTLYTLDDDFSWATIASIADRFEICGNREPEKVEEPGAPSHASEAISTCEYGGMYKTISDKLELAILDVKREHPLLPASRVHDKLVQKGVAISRHQVGNYLHRLSRRIRLSACVYKYLVEGRLMEGFFPSPTGVRRSCREKVWHSKGDLQFWMDFVIAKNHTPKRQKNGSVGFTRLQLDAFLLNRIDALRNGTARTRNDRPVPYTTPEQKAIWEAMLPNPDAPEYVLHQNLRALGWTITHERTRRLRDQVGVRTRLPNCAYLEMLKQYKLQGTNYKPKVSDLSTVCEGRRIYQSSLDLANWIDLIIATGETPDLWLDVGVRMTPKQVSQLLRRLIDQH